MYIPLNILHVATTLRNSLEMSTTDPCVVVVGEASETDSEDEEIEHPPHVRPQLASSSDKGGVVVQGEASETDSDDEPVQVKSRQQSPESLLIPADFPPLKGKYSLYIQITHTKILL